MRRITSLLLTAVMILSLFTVGLFTTTVSAAPAASFGTVESGYTPSGTPINSEEDFLAMKENGDYYLAKDISISSTYGVAYNKDGTPILDTFNNVLAELIFSGTLDGNGKTVTLSAPMFAEMEGATVKNLIIKGSINFRSDNGLNLPTHCGTIAMQSTDTTLENISNSAILKGYETAKTIRMTNPDGTEALMYESIYTGALVGAAFGDLTAKNCENYANITAHRASGLVGSLEKATLRGDGSDNTLVTTALFENCNNYGTISDNDCHDLFAEEEGIRVLKIYAVAAGILTNGTATEISFLNCTNTGDILTSNSVAPISGGGNNGGISGQLVRSDDLGNGMHVIYDNCINDGTVIGAHRGGGIGGYAAGDITATNCINNGDITSLYNYAAGIISRPGCSSYPNFVCDLVFENCINNGTITSHRQYAAGMISYTQDRLKVNYCLNTGDILAEGVTKTSDNNTHNHPIQCGGLVARSVQSVEMYYCVNTGNIISNFTSAGIAGDVGSGSIGGVSFTGGYNTFFGCLSAGDVVAYNEKHLYTMTQDPNEDGYCDDAAYDLCTTDTKREDGTAGSDGICDSVHCKGKINEDYHKTYYSSGLGAAGIFSYSFGSGNRQAPRIFGCGVTANIIATHTGAACAFLGYANTAYALIEGNYFTGTLTGPETCTSAHQITGSTDYCLEYATAWIDRQDSEKYIKNNYYLESIRDSGAMRIQNNGAEIGWSGYDCFITTKDISSGKLCYLANKAAYGFINVYPFLQRLGIDQYPTSPYYYLTYNGVDQPVTIDYTYWVNQDAEGNYVNELHTPDVSKDPIEPNDTTDPNGETTTPETDPVTQPETDPVTQPPVESNGTGEGDGDAGGCGSVVGASIALAVIAIAAPAVIVLKKREDEE